MQDKLKDHLNKILEQFEGTKQIANDPLSRVLNYSKKENQEVVGSQRKTDRRSL
jgi:hypothetical protein